MKIAAVGSANVPEGSPQAADPDELVLPVEPLLLEELLTPFEALFDVDDPLPDAELVPELVPVGVFVGPLQPTAKIAAARPSALRMELPPTRKVRTPRQ